jgi:hypothetical protein
MNDLTVVMPFNEPSNLIFKSIESVFYDSDLKIKLILIYNDVNASFLSGLKEFVIDLKI